MAQLEEISGEMAEKLHVSENITAPMLLDGEPNDRPPSPQHSTTSIVYEPLVPNTAQVRLLTLHPSQFDDDIRCSLHRVSLTSNPQYEALSYVWGDAAKTLPVIVDGYEKQVTTNLEAALRHLRWQEKPRILWIDAICINQDDIEEKSAQVPMMGDIYRQARSVIVWLGYDLPFAEDAITWMKQCAPKQTSKASHDVIIPDMCTGTYARVMLGVICLLKDRYWHRMWTYQEFFLAAETPICVHGHMSFTLATLYATFTATMKRNIDGLSRCGHEISHKIFSIAQQEMAEFVSDMPSLWLLKSMAHHAILKTPSPGEIVLLLHQSANRECSDPRDRIYALYGRDPSLSQLMPVDYTKPEREVILEAIALMVRSRDSRLWSMFGLRTERFSRTSTFPSWAPNLDRVPRFQHEACDLDVLNFYGQEIEADRVSSDLATLHLRAWNLGHCKVLHRMRRPDIYDSVDNGLTSQFSAFVESLWANKLDSTGHRLCQKFARCAALGGEGQHEISNEGLVEACRAICSDSSLGRNGFNGKFKTKELELVARVEITLGDVACIITSSGCVGFAPFETRDNDLVVFPRVMGSPAIVLRKEVADLGEADQESYIMVGSANVYAPGVAEDENFLTVVSKVREVGVAEYIIH